jgi:hypothetical protein
MSVMIKPFGPIGPLDAVDPGDVITVTVDVLGIIPFTADIHSELAKQFNVFSVSRGWFSSEVDVTLRADRQETAGALGQRVAQALDDAFVRIVDVDPIRYVRRSSVPGPSDGGPSISTTISLASMAVLAVVGVYAYRQLSQ